MMTSEGVRTVFGGGFERSPWYNVFSNFGSALIFQQSSSYEDPLNRTIGSKTCFLSLLVRLTSSVDEYSELHTVKVPLHINEFRKC